ncbi:MAG: BCCT family transporter [Halothiobacillaceae bacterium]
MDKNPESSPDRPDETIGIRTPEGATNLIDTDYKIGQDNYQAAPLGIDIDIHSTVFSFSALVILAFVVLSLIFPDQTTAWFGAARDWINSRMSWFLLLSGNIFLLLCLALIFSPLGKVRIGGPEAKPDFNYLSWLAMLSAAGMGIGLMFYGVSQPLSHYSAAYDGIQYGVTYQGEIPAGDEAVPEGWQSRDAFNNALNLHGSSPAAVSEAIDATVPEDMRDQFSPSDIRSDWAPLQGAKGDQNAALNLAMASTIFHWTLHAWAIYAIVALSLALFAFNKGLPLTMRSMFYPVLGDRIWGWPGHIIDILAVFAILFGLATSLGIGAQQVSAGLNYLFDIPSSTTTLMLLIAAITAVAVVSIIAGVDKGVRRLSELNMVLAFLLLMFVVAVGPTLLIITGFAKNIGLYLVEFPQLANPFGREDANFTHGWTTFYWAWWISWSPFVGMFIARVSRGRSVRMFLANVLLIPSIASAFWMTAFGTTAIEQLQQGFEGVKDAEVSLQLFEMLSQLPLTEITSFIAIVLVIIFFVTSSDSGSLVIDTIAAGGKIDAPKQQRVFWGVLEGAIAFTLLIGGGLAALQSAVVAAGLPFTFVLLVGCYAIIKGLMSEPRGT